MLLEKYIGRSMLGVEFAAGKQPSYWLHRQGLGVAAGGRMVAIEAFATDSNAEGYGDLPPGPWNTDPNAPVSAYNVRLSNYHVGSKVKVVLPEPNPDYFADHPAVASAWQAFANGEHTLTMLARPQEDGHISTYYYSGGPVHFERDGDLWIGPLLLTYPNEVYNWTFFIHDTLGQCRIKWGVSFFEATMAVHERFERWTGKRWRRVNLPPFHAELPTYNGPLASISAKIQAPHTLVPWSVAMEKDAYRVSYLGFDLVADHGKFVLDRGYWGGSYTTAKVDDMFVVTPQTEPANTITVTRGSVEYLDNHAVPEIIRGADLTWPGYCFKSSETVDQRDFWSSSLQFDINPKVSTAPTPWYVDRHDLDGTPTDNHFQTWIAAQAFPVGLPFHSMTSSWWDFGCMTWSDWEGDIIPYLPSVTDSAPMDVSAIRSMPAGGGGDLYLWYLRFVYEDVGEYRYAMVYEFTNLAWDEVGVSFKPLARTPGTETYTITDVIDDGYQNRWWWAKYRKSDWALIDWDGFPDDMMGEPPESHATAVATVLGYFSRVE